MKKKKQSTGIVNRRARFDYDLGDSLLLGIVLTGKETKALRLGHGHLRGAYATVKDGELWLFNATIASAPNILLTETEQTRSRKLLANKREIKQLIDAKDQGKSIIPLEILTKGRYIKVRVSSGRGKKLYDKRQVLKKRDEQRNIDAAIKNH
jgi:SsrA-binding protein